MKTICKIKTALIDVLTGLGIILNIVLYVFIYINAGDKIKAGMGNWFDNIFFWVNSGSVILLYIGLILGIIIIGIIEYKIYLDNKC